MRQADIRRGVALLVLVAAIIVDAFAGGSVGLVLLPALLLALPLVLGRYPGEELIARLTRRRRASAHPSRRIVLPRAPRALGRRLAPLAAIGASRAPPLPA